MPDHSEVAQLFKRLEEKRPGSMPWGELELREYEELGRKAQVLMNDPLWQIFAAELARAAKTIDGRLAAIREALEARVPREEKEIRAMERERDYAHGLRDAYNAALASCEEMVKEGKWAKELLLLRDEKEYIAGNGAN